MTSITHSGDLKRAHLAAWLDFLAGGAIVYALPLLMIVINKSALPVLCAAAAMCVAASLLTAPSPGAALRACLPPLSIEWALAAALIVWALLSLFWSIDRAASAFGLGEALIALLASAIVAVRLQVASKARAMRHLSIALTLTAAIILVELMFDMPIRRLIGMRPETPQYNRAIEVSALLIAPLIASLLTTRRNLATWLVAAFVMGVAFLSDSGAGSLGMAVAFATMIVAYHDAAFPRRFGVIAAIILLASAPWLGAALHALAPARVEAAMRGAHMSERVNIWRAYGHVVARHPVVGTGIATSASITRSGLLEDAPVEIREQGRTHPHNFFLQLWTELGAVGALLFAMIIWRMFHRIGEQLADRRIASLTFVAAAAAVSLVSHGAWQGWLMASYGAGLALLLALWRAPDY